MKGRFLSTACILAASGILSNSAGQNATESGYRGIWFSIGQAGTYGPKYSGGLGTYTADHTPMALYAPAANKTFFVWGGTQAVQQDLMIMCSYYDHATGTFPRPTIVRVKTGVTDPHDDPAISLDDSGFVWVFIAGRATIRPGYIYKSARPYDITSFTLMKTLTEFAYPQPWYVPGKGFFVQFTKYTGGRELYWMTSSDGISWSAHRKLAGFGGHYLVSWMSNGRIIAAFNWHPNGDVDKRTNLYFVQTDDMGATWKTVEGQTISTPIDSVNSPARVRNYSAENLLTYINNVAFDTQGNPAICYIKSKNSAAGPQTPTRDFMVAHWTGSQWTYRAVATVNHNYSMGSLYIEDDGTWRIIAPTGVGPQVWGTGGEMEMWTSADGDTWQNRAALTSHSAYNHSYARQPYNADPGFYAFWADGDADSMSPSQLYFATKAGRVYRMPDTLIGQTAAPIEVTPPITDIGPSPVLRSSHLHRSLSVKGGTIRYDLTQQQRATITASDCRGRMVAVFATGLQSAGSHAIELPRMPPGVYCIRMRSAGDVWDAVTVLRR